MALPFLADNKVNVDDLLNAVGEEPRFCACPELLIGEGRKQKRVPIMKWHDCGYVWQRNQLIPQASKLASERVKLTEADDNQSVKTKWTREFSNAMDELARPLLQNGA